MCIALLRYLPDFGTVLRVRRVFKSVLTYEGIYLTLVQFCTCMTVFVLPDQP